jgi:DNA-binding CsgD family transcriptional regulator
MGGSDTSGGEQDIIIRLYEAAVDQADPGTVLIEICRWLEAQKICSFAVHPIKGELEWGWFEAVDPDDKALTEWVEDQMKSVYAAPGQNPWLGAAARYAPGAVLDTDTLTPREALLESSFYREFVEPADILESLGTNLTKDPGLFASFSVYRSGELGPFADEEKRRCVALFPHLRRVAQLQSKLDFLRKERRGALGALDHLRAAVFLVGANGRVAFANKRAEEIVGEEDGLQLVSGVLSAADHTTSRLLEGCIESAIQTGAGRGEASGGELSVPRPSGLRAYEVIVAPLPTHALVGRLQVGMAVVFVSDPEKEPDFLESTLENLYGLTPAEAKVAGLIAIGSGVEAVAGRLGVSTNTVRTHLYRVFDKTGARRQGELIRILMAGPGAVLPSPQ